MRKFYLKGKAIKRFMEGQPTDRPEEGRPSVSAPEETPLITGGLPSGFRFAFRTDVGKLRKNNQDAIIFGNGLAGVADGMGGHNGGEIASGELRDSLIREAEGKKANISDLEQMIGKINYEIWLRQEKDATLTGMGTTLTLLWPDDSEVLVAQVGDSRAYLLRNGELKQVTEDHSMVADMVRKGVLTEEQAACHPMRNYITRAVGTEDTIEVDLFSFPREKGDRWMICSDGLYGQVSKEELRTLLGVNDPEAAAESMIRAALENGGRDNISVLLLYDDGPVQNIQPLSSGEKEAEQ